MPPLIPNHFDRGKPFYPLVTLYIAQLAGFKEIAVRGMPGHRGDAESRFDVSALPSETAEVIQKLLGPLQLRSEFQESPIEISLDDLGSEIAANFTYLARWLSRASSGLFVLAHEMTKGEAYHDNGPLWEFLRHCRNAGAHGGRFTLYNNEPSCPAEWGPFQITQSLQGMNLMKDQDGDGLLSLGDPIRLLWDIEQAYPDMTAAAEDLEGK